MNKQAQKTTITYKMEGFLRNLVLNVTAIFGVIAFGWVNLIYNYVVMHSIFGWKCSKDEHERKVEAVQRQVQNWADGDRKRKLCSARPGWKSISVSKVDKSGYHQVELGSLNDLIEIDEEDRV